MLCSQLQILQHHQQYHYGRHWRVAKCLWFRQCDGPVNGWLNRNGVDVLRPHFKQVHASDGNDIKSSDFKSRFKITYMVLWPWFKSFVWRRSWFWFKIKFHVILILKSLFNHLKSLLNQFEKLIEENSDFAVKVVQYAIISGSGCWLVRNTSTLGQEKVSTTTPPSPPPLADAREVEFIHKSGKTVTVLQKLWSWFWFWFSRQKCDFDLKSVFGLRFWFWF